MYRGMYGGVQYWCWVSTHDSTKCVYLGGGGAVLVNGRTDKRTKGRTAVTVAPESERKDRGS